MMINEGRYGSEQILDPDTVGLLVENQLPEFPGDEHGLGWESHSIEIPEDINYIRFSYKTDASTNGRGWYVSNIHLGNKAIDFASDCWVRRNY